MPVDVTHNPWICCKQVLPQHTDHAGVLWHGAYVAWLEEARVEALAAAGVDYAELSGQGLELMVVRLELQYRRALKHGERVALRSWLGPEEGVRIPFHTALYGGDGGLAAEACVTLALVDRERGRLKRQMPAELADAFARLRRGPAVR